jgi:phospho-N-acetylmuramoyl-pentapeptide-transferase
LLLIIAFGFIGLWDDLSKISHKKGMSANLKFSLQCLIAFIISALLVKFGSVEPIIALPLLKDVAIPIGFGFILWAAFILVGCSNAVNLTDGLDGLAIGAIIPNFALFGIISYLAGHKQLASYLYIPYAHSEEMTVVSAILVGASLGFLWFNAYPAQIFMGDVGSLALGAALAYIALVSKQELLLPIAGGLFVLETVSVILQIFSIKMFGKRVFRMAPIHHHFELIGWPESRITIRFCIISLVLCLIALITLKIR